MSIAELLEGKRVCVCGGSGGVGKTTTSAAVALGMAARGAKVAVVTIDPAKRLANALGLEALENEPRRVPPDRLGDGFKGELWAMMLDPKRTFDELIERIAADPEHAEEIKANRVYRELSTAVSGSRSSPRWPSSTSLSGRDNSTCWCWTRRRRATRWTSSRHPGA